MSAAGFWHEGVRIDDPSGFLRDRGRRSPRRTPADDASAWTASTSAGWIANVATPGPLRRLIPNVSTSDASTPAVGPMSSR